MSVIYLVKRLRRPLVHVDSRDCATKTWTSVHIFHKEGVVDLGRQGFGINICDFVDLKIEAFVC
jgi:hypothetical protein